MSSEKDTAVRNMLGSESVDGMNDRYPESRSPLQKETRQSSIPTLQSPSHKSNTPNISPQPATRPRISSVQSFQRPRKKVIWRGKTCVIAMPIDDMRGARSQPLLTPADVEARLRQWELEGLGGGDAQGSCLNDPSLNHRSPVCSIQSCSVYPDPTEIRDERRLGAFKVKIPNPAEWKAWMMGVSEEKVRAHRIPSTDAELSPPVYSPIPPSASRTSSRGPNLPITPSDRPVSDTSNRIFEAAGSASPEFYSPNNSSFQFASRASHTFERTDLLEHMHSSQHTSTDPAMETQLHIPKIGGAEMTTKSHIIPSLQGPLLENSTVLPAPGSAFETPEIALSPVSPFTENDTKQIMGRLQQFGEMGQQQRDLQEQIFRQQHHIKKDEEDAQGVVKDSAEFAVYSPSSLEILHPTPRGHQRNVSEVLQKEVDNAETSNNIANDVAHQDIKGPKRSSFDSDAFISDDVYQRGFEDEPEINPALSASPAASIKESDSATRKIRAQPPYLIDQLNNGGKEHTKPSASKLNVKAQEFKFKPHGGFKGSNFRPRSSDSDRPGPNLNPFASVFNPNSYRYAYPNNAESQAPHLNVAAPAFTPSAGVSPVQSKDFTFTSSKYSSDTPVFNSDQSESRYGLTNPARGLENPSGTNGKIFGSFSLYPTIQSAKNLPKGNSDGGLRGSIGGDKPGDADDDENGRPRPPLARQKRVRRSGGEADHVTHYYVQPPLEHEQRHTGQLRDPDAYQGQLTGDQYASAYNSKMLSAFSPSSAATDEQLAWADLDPPKSKSSREKLDSTEQYSTGTLNATEPAPFPMQLPVKTRDDVPANLDESAPQTGTEGDIEDRGDTEGRFSSEVLGHNQKTSPTARAQHSESGSISGTAPDRPHLVRSQNKEGSKSSRIALHAYSPKPLQPQIDTPNSDGKPQSREIGESSATFMIPDGKSSPSYEEIDAVMKQFEEHPELGVERLETPPITTIPFSMSHVSPHTELRSDAPSPSPKSSHILHHVVNNSAETDLQSAPQPVKLGIRAPAQDHIRQGDNNVSDWNDALSSADEAKFNRQSQFFDVHVSNLLDGILGNRLEPLETTLKTIQHSVALIAHRPIGSSQRRILSGKTEDSDADDEDDSNDLDWTSSYQSRSPMTTRDRKVDPIRAAVMEALESHRSAAHECPPVDLSAIHDVLTEMKLSMPQMQQGDLKAVVEDVISTHPRLRGHRVQQSHNFGSKVERYKLQIDGLESMLIVANERAEDECKLRWKLEDKLADASRRVKHAEEEAAQYRESSEEAERILKVYHEEKESIEGLKQTGSELSLKNAALETTLEEYRLSSDQWRNEIQDERARNKELRTTLNHLKLQMDESTQCKENLRNKFERLQDDMAIAVKDIAHDQASWRKKEHDMQNTLDQEARRREKAEAELVELDRIKTELAEAKVSYDHAQREIGRLQDLTSDIRQKSMQWEDSTFKFKRELDHAQEDKQREVQSAEAAWQTELKVRDTQFESVRLEYQDQIARLQHQLENAQLDAKDAAVKHEGFLRDTTNNYRRMLQDAVEDKGNALREQHAAQEANLNEHRSRHVQAMQEYAEDRRRHEEHMSEKLALSIDKNQYLGAKVTDLEERLEITKSAARAAVEAATSKVTKTPAPTASAGLSSPRAGSGSINFAKGSETPEKISPQAFRETILVLQDQLQNREQVIENLEVELASVDKEAPAKIKDRDIEITWLRELLGVRNDDLAEIITALSQPTYDRGSVRDAAIRLRANLQMEQQEKERAFTGTGGDNSTVLTSISSIAQTPRAIPMAAAAVWGNWRKPTLTDLANLGSQTPSRASAQSFLNGLLSPQTSSMWQAAPTPSSAPPVIMTYGPEASSRRPSSEARPLRAYNKRQRSVSAKQERHGPNDDTADTPQPPQFQQFTHREPPSTPTLMRYSSYDRDAEDTKCLGDDEANEETENVKSNDKNAQGASGGEEEAVKATKVQH